MSVSQSAQKKLLQITAQISWFKDDHVLFSNKIKNRDNQHNVVNIKTQKGRINRIVLKEMQRFGKIPIFRTKNT